MPTIKSAKKDPLYGNPPSIRECFSIDGLGKPTIHIETITSGFVEIRQGNDVIQMCSDHLPALVEACNRLIGLDTYLVYDRKYRKDEL